MASPNARNAGQEIRGAIHSPLSRDFSTNLRSGLVGSDPHVNRLPQEPVVGPGQIKYVISVTSRGSTQWTRDRTSDEPKRVWRGGGSLSGELARANGSRRRLKSASTFSGIPVPTRPA